MLEGTHDGNLLTNQSFVGQNIIDVSGQTFVDITLTDYLSNPIIPTRVNVRIVTSFGTSVANIQNGQEYVVGRQDAGALRVRATIDNNKITLRIKQYSSSHIISEVGTIELLEIDANGRTYNEFKFQD